MGGNVVSEPSSTGVEAVASLPDRIAQAIDKAVDDANLALAMSEGFLPVERTALQVLRAAEVDRRVLAWAAGRTGPAPKSLLADLVERYGVSADLCDGRHPLPGQPADSRRVRLRVPRAHGGGAVTDPLPDPLPGTIFLSPVHGPAGALIHLGQAIALRPCRFGHAGIVGPDGTIIQAMPHGAEQVGLDTVAPGTIFLDRMAAVLSEAQLQRVVVAAETFLGPPPVGYGWWDYGSLALLHLGVRLPAVADYVASLRTAICSQLVDAAYLRAGLHLFADGRRPGDVMPVSLWDWYESKTDADLAAWAAEQAA
jgi:hypothetical protein